MNTDATTKLVRQRLSVLELAQRLNDVPEACRQRGSSRITVREWSLTTVPPDQPCHA